MIKFNENLLNYKSKSFATLSIDNIGTRIRDDAYSIDMYDDNHFFLGVYIANPFVEGDNYKLMNYIFKRNVDMIDDGFKIKMLNPHSLNDIEEKNVIAFKFVLDTEGNVCDFAINPEKIKIDYKLNTNEIEELYKQNEDDLGYRDYEVLTQLNVMHILNDLIYSKLFKNGNAESRDLENEFGLSFISQFLNLTNIYTAKFLKENNIPFLYYNLVCKDSLGTNLNLIDGYYSDKFDGNIRFDEEIGAFTSPLRNGADLINISILDDFFVRNKKITEENIEYWKNHLKNVRISKVSHNYNNLKRGRK